MELELTCRNGGRSESGGKGYRGATLTLGFKGGEAIRSALSFFKASTFSLDMEDFLEPTLGLCRAFLLCSVGSKRGLAYKKDPALLNDSSSEASTAVHQQQCIRDIMDFGSNVVVLLELSRSCEANIADIASECVLLLLKAAPREATTGFLTNLLKVSTILESSSKGVPHLVLQRILHALAYSCGQYLSHAMKLAMSINEISRIELNSKTSTYPISTSPAFLTNSPSPSPFQELPPDIAPLLPSPGGVLPPPTVSSDPTIPSTPSPPNPDGVVAPGPDSAFSPLGALLASSASPRNLINFATAVGSVWRCYGLLSVVTGGVCCTARSAIHVCAAPVRAVCGSVMTTGMSGTALSCKGLHDSGCSGKILRVVEELVEGEDECSIFLQGRIPCVTGFGIFARTKSDICSKN
ncbi:hypothetical protein SADUNF_Sadunf10G0032400 [Salix dunnii]|uniref:RUNKEL ARM-repeat domain-containing protein n=1 Tax=Salix dunnii TaxID=1413687 RepID=A0A835JQQ6_9ROSI|nr:hypothetical protein SADUNF_Sadunf10G0032400 [Salix dunnii]